MCHAARIGASPVTASIREPVAHAGLTPAPHARFQLAHPEHALQPRWLMARLRWPLLIAMPFVALHGSEPGRTQPASESRKLPAAEVRGGAPVWTVIATRRSLRVFDARDLSDGELAQLLWAAQGTDDGHRTAPSAGALYPLTVRVVDARGIWRYVPVGHALVHEAPRDRRAALADAAFRQQVVRTAPVTLVITADVAITAGKYGRRAAERFVMLEAGHVAQNVLLAATALDLAAVPIGAFDEADLRATLALPANATPLYLIPVGARP